MNIFATLDNCINALSGMKIRVDQMDIAGTAQAVINTLREVKTELLRLEQEQAEQELQKAEAENSDTDSQEESMPETEE